MGNRVKLKKNPPRLNRPPNPIEKLLKLDNSFGRYNAYVCQSCDKAYLTLDVDQGVTPMFGPCLATPGCQGRAVSAGYPEGEPPAHMGEPIIHWYRPTEEELKHLPAVVRAHVRDGGLARKATAAAPEWVRALVHQ